MHQPRSLIVFLSLKHWSEPLTKRMKTSMHQSRVQSRNEIFVHPEIMDWNPEMVWLSSVDGSCLSSQWPWKIQELSIPSKTHVTRRPKIRDLTPFVSIIAWISRITAWIFRNIAWIFRIIAGLCRLPVHGSSTPALSISYHKMYSYTWGVHPMCIRCTSIV